ncbi:MAG: Ubiquinone/menaquinone biosynthesis C-methyltransferase UbiE [Phycisphaerae bacterium]|nr:Ubiquinone/menaquinone biosynthesis C-methyltransferase UbiE [Phycisphaerae bacterium]
MTIRALQDPHGNEGGLTSLARRHANVVLAAIVAVAATAGACRAPRAAEVDRPRETSVKPGINAPYRTEPVETWVARFEAESREIYRERERLTTWIGLKDGQHVADIGAGTGFFTLLFSRAVGDGGKVYAVDLMPGFVEHIRLLAEHERLANVVPVVCKEDSVELPPNSVDVAFICDTYHHFEYPRSTMASIRHALRPGGQLIIIDFIRIPGVSRDWILDHVRAGREEVIAEIESDGFTLIEAPDTSDLEENYVLRFRKR